MILSERSGWILTRESADSYNQNTTYKSVRQLLLAAGANFGNLSYCQEYMALGRNFGIWTQNWTTLVFGRKTGQ